MYTVCLCKSSSACHLISINKDDDDDENTVCLNFCYKLTQYCVVAESYEDIVMEPLPFRAFGFTSAVEFVTKKMPDVARITT